MSAAILVGTMVLTSWLAAELIARTIAWQIKRDPDLRSSHLRRFARWRRNHFVALLISYLLALYVIGWGQILEKDWRDALESWFGFESPGNLTGFQVGLMAPFFVALLLAWERYYSVERTAFDLAQDPENPLANRFMSKGTYLLLQVRHQMLLVLPPILLLLSQQLLLALVPDWKEESYPAAIVATVMMGTMFLAMPLLLRVFLGLKPLPAGPLRERLVRVGQRMHFGYSNILIWNTRQISANALVTGFVPWIRYVVLTDRLIEELTPDEIEAVFGHEIGHIKHHHLIFYMTFFLTSFILLGLCWEVAKDWVKQEAIMSNLQALPYVGEDIYETLKTLSSFGKLALMAGYTLFVFGFLSRRCERQADLFGSHIVSTDVFISALEKVAAINGIPRDRSTNWLLSWQHPTIAQRVEFLETMRDKPTLIRRFHSSIAMLQVSFFVGFGLLVWLLNLPRVWVLLAEF